LGVILNQLAVLGATKLRSTDAGVALAVVFERLFATL
jgi:hypothetical protein